MPGDHSPPFPKLAEGCRSSWVQFKSCLPGLRLSSLSPEHHCGLGRHCNSRVDKRLLEPDKPSVYCSPSASLCLFFIITHRRASLCAGRISPIQHPKEGTWQAPVLRIIPLCSSHPGTTFSGLLRAASHNTAAQH